MAQDKMPNGQRRPLGPLTYKQIYGWRHFFDGTRQQVTYWHVIDAKGRAVCHARTEQDAKDYIRVATS
jgi:hypothetical protein